MYSKSQFYMYKFVVSRCKIYFIALRKKKIKQISCKMITNFPLHGFSFRIVGRNFRYIMYLTSVTKYLEIPKHNTHLLLSDFTNNIQYRISY